MRNWSGGLAKAVEEHEEEDGDDGVDESGDAEMNGEPRLRLREKQAPRQRDDSLVHGKKSDGQGKACGGMFRIEARADRGS